MPTLTKSSCLAIGENVQLTVFTLHTDYQNMIINTVENHTIATSLLNMMEVY